MASWIRTVALLTAVLVLSMGQNGVGAAARQKAGAVSAGGVAERRLAHLRRGINLSDWFAQVGDPSGYNKQHFDTAITPHDLDLIQAMGFDHVRLSVDPRPMFHARQADQIAGDELNYLDAAVKMI